MNHMNPQAMEARQPSRVMVTIEEATKSILDLSHEIQELRARLEWTMSPATPQEAPDRSVKTTQLQGPSQIEERLMGILCTISTAMDVLADINKRLTI